MKYVIEIEDVPFSKVRFGDDVQNLNLYRAKDFNALVFDKEGLDKLTPLDKELDEAYQKGYNAAWINVGECEDRVAKQAYQKGLDNAWKTIMTIAKMPDGEREKVFRDWRISNILNKFSTSEIINILDGYKPEQDEIKVGDEVSVYGINGNVIVGNIIVVEVDGDCVDLSDLRSWHNWYDRKNVKKTGRYFPQVAELFKVMKGDAE